MSTIDELLRLVPPPPRPVDGDGEWRRVWAFLGCRLPDDYQDLVRRYGLGSFSDVSGWTPFTAEPWGNVVVRARALVDNHEPLRGEYPEDFPYPLYPEPGGCRCRGIPLRLPERHPRGNAAAAPAPGTVV